MGSFCRCTFIMRNKVFTAARNAVNPESNHVFYSNPVPIAVILCSVFLLVMIAMYAVMFFIMPVAEAQALLLPLLPLCGVGVLCEIVFALLLSRLSPIRVADSGITLTDFWGRKRTLSWGEIETVTPAKCLSIPCLRVDSFRKDHAPLLLPMELSRSPKFRESLSYYASSVNPVRRFVEDGELPAQREPLT